MPAISTLTPYLLAYEFSACLRGMLDTAKMNEVVRLNRTPEYEGNSVCASHNFCDANEAMLEALEGVGLTFDPADDKQTDLTNKAWAIAKRCEFNGEQILSECTLEPDDDGTFAFVSMGIQIIIPTFDESGGFVTVGPAHYGFYVTETVGGCTAWRREFRLSDGREAYMLVTAFDEASHRLDADAEWIGMGVYLDDDTGDTWINWRQNVQDPNLRDDIAAGGEWARRPESASAQTAAAPTPMLRPTRAQREEVQAEARADMLAEHLDQAHSGTEFTASDLIAANRCAGPVESLLVLPLIARVRALQQEIAAIRDAVDNARRLQP